MCVCPGSFVVVWTVTPCECVQVWGCVCVPVHMYVPLYVWGCVSDCVCKGQRDTVLHITALQMAVVSGCDSESEWVPTPYRCTLSDLTNTVELKQAPYLSLSLWHTLSILTQPLRGIKSCFLSQEYIKGQEYISREQERCIARVQESITWTKKILDWRISSFCHL